MNKQKKKDKVFGRSFSLVLQKLNMESVAERVDSVKSTPENYNPANVGVTTDDFLSAEKGLTIQTPDQKKNIIISKLAKDAVHACKKDEGTKLMKLINDKQLNLFIVSSKGKTLLHYAAQSKGVNCLRILLSTSLLLFSWNWKLYSSWGIS